MSEHSRNLPGKSSAGSEKMWLDSSTNNGQSCVQSMAMPKDTYGFHKKWQTFPYENPNRNTNFKSLSTFQDNIAKDITLLNSSENCVSNQNKIVKDFCEYWNTIDGSNDVYHENKIQNKSVELKDTSATSTNLTPNNSYIQNLSTSTSCEETNVSLSREEIKALRRLKVADRRQKKKMEKQQLRQLDIGVQAVKPSFSLKEAAEDFPALNSSRKRRFLGNKSNDYGTNIPLHSESESKLVADGIGSNKPREKSWKPKVKDPISIDLSAALQHKSEKQKLITKKVDSSANPSKLVGNTLDSDNPQMKKGKVRPNKINKPTKLKKQILSERNERRRMRMEEDQLEKPDEFEIPNHNLENSIVSELTICLNNVEDFKDEEAIHPVCPKLTDEMSELLDRCIHKKIEDLENKQIYETPKKPYHSRKFREYCTNCLTDDLTTNVCSLLEKVAYFQDRTFARDPIRANAKRRYVVGIHQSMKYLIVKKVKLLIIAPDLERSSGKDGLDEKIHKMKKEAESDCVPCVYGPNRSRLGKSVFRRALVSCVAVLSYEGAEELFSKVLEALEDAQSKYQSLESTYSENNAKQKIVPAPVEDSCVPPIDDVTASLLALLKEDVSPADKLLRAIQESAYDSS